MMKKLLGRRAKTQKSYKTPEGQVAYVIGDVHGCFKALQALIEKIDAHAKIQAPNGYSLVFLGDLIDRGPRSKEVVEYCMAFERPNVEVIFLKGNHEEVFLKVLNGDEDRLGAWFQFGGKKCLASYGVDNFGEIHLNPENLLYRAQSMVPKEHIEFVQTFKDYHVFGDYLFVHAGIKPGRALKDQKPKDMRWIRDGFLSYKKPHPYKVVHGHSIVEKAEDFGNRIAVDTGGYNGGPLTAVFLKDETIEFITSH